MIEFLTLEGCAPIEIHRRMKAVYGDGCIDVKNVRKWVRHAKSCRAGEMSVLDEHRPGRNISVTRDENKCRVDAMIQENRRIKQRDIALKLGISQERVHHIIETLNYRKVSKGMISSSILPLETNPGFIIMTRKTKSNPWNIVILVIYFSIIQLSNALCLCLSRSLTPVFALSLKTKHCFPSQQSALSRPLSPITHP